MNKIKKPTSIVTSLGRTGTKFFAECFENIISGVTSYHEPDIIHLAPSRGDTIQKLVSTVSNVGYYNLLIKKSIGKWSVIEISDKRISGQITDEAAARRLFRQRKNFIESQESNVYFESNDGFYGLIDILPDIFDKQRVVYIIRDGRDWIRSKMDWAEMYNKGCIKRMLGHTWLTARNFRDDDYYSSWSEMNRFERLCWAWEKLNRKALATLSGNPHAKMYKFEHIFKGEDRYNKLEELIEFLFDHPGLNIGNAYKSHEWLERKIHKSSRQFPAWTDWTSEQKNTFITICGSLMEDLDYL